MPQNGGNGQGQREGLRSREWATLDRLGVLAKVLAGRATLDAEGCPVAQLEPSFYDAARATLTALGFVHHPASVNLLAAWSRCEKPAGDTAWQWNNPLNTTMSCCGGVSVNPVGVKQYPTREAGVEATVRTLRLSFYPRLRAALQQGDAAAFFAASEEIGTWGTRPDCIRSVYGRLGPPPPPPGAPIPFPELPDVLPLALGLAAFALGATVGFVAAGRLMTRPTAFSAPALSSD